MPKHHSTTHKMDDTPQHTEELATETIVLERSDDQSHETENFVALQDNLTTIPAARATEQSKEEENPRHSEHQESLLHLNTENLALHQRLATMSAERMIYVSEHQRLSQTLATMSSKHAHQEEYIRHVHAENQTLKAENLRRDTALLLSQSQGIEVFARLMAEQQALQGTIAQKNLVIQEQEARIQQLMSRQSLGAESYVHLKAEKQDLQAAMTQQDLTIQKQEAHIRQLMSTPSQEAESYTRLKAEKEELQKTNAQKDLTIKRHEARIAQLLALQSQQQDLVQPLQNEIARKNLIIFNQKTEISKLKMQQPQEAMNDAFLQAQNQAQKQQLAKQSESIKQLQSAQSQGEASIAALKTKNQAQKELIAQQKSEIDAQKESVNQFKSEEFRRKKTVANLKAKNELQEEQMAAKDLKINQQQNEIQRLEGLLSKSAAHLKNPPKRLKTQDTSSDENTERFDPSYNHTSPLSLESASTENKSRSNLYLKGADKKQRKHLEAKATSTDSKTDGKAESKSDSFQAPAASHSFEPPTAPLSFEDPASSRSINSSATPHSFETLATSAIFEPQTARSSLQSSSRSHHFFNQAKQTQPSSSASCMDSEETQTNHSAKNSKDSHPAMLPLNTIHAATKKHNVIRAVGLECGVAGINIGKFHLALQKVKVTITDLRSISIEKLRDILEKEFGPGYYEFSLEKLAQSEVNLGEMIKNSSKADNDHTRPKAVMEAPLTSIKRRRHETVIYEDRPVVDEQRMNVGESMAQAETNEDGSWLDNYDAVLNTFCRQPANW